MVNSCTVVFVRGKNQGKVCNQVDPDTPCANSAHRKKRGSTTTSPVTVLKSNIKMDIVDKHNLIMSSSQNGSIASDSECDEITDQSTSIESDIQIFLAAGVDAELAKEFATKKREKDLEKIKQNALIRDQQIAVHKENYRKELITKIHAINNGPKMPRNDGKFYELLRTKKPGTDKFPDIGIKDYLETEIFPLGQKGLVVLLDQVLRDDYDRYPFILYGNKEVQWVKDLDQCVYEEIVHGKGDTVARDNNGITIKRKYIPYNYDSDIGDMVYPDSDDEDDWFYDKYLDELPDKNTGIKLYAETSRDYDEFRHLLLTSLRTVYHNYTDPLENRAYMEHLGPKMPKFENKNNLPLWKWNSIKLKLEKDWNDSHKHDGDTDPLAVLNDNTNYLRAKHVLRFIDVQHKIEKPVRIYNAATTNKIEQKSNELKNMYTDPKNRTSHNKVQLDPDEYKELAIFELQKTGELPKDDGSDILSIMGDESPVLDYMDSVIDTFRATFPNCRN